MYVAYVFFGESMRLFGLLIGKFTALACPSDITMNSRALTGWHFAWIEPRASAKHTLGMCNVNSPPRARSSRVTAAGFLW